MQALPRRKHVKVLVQTALLEVREGAVERGRTMFESILRNYPRRTDIWSTYIDQEIKQGDPDRTRVGPAESLPKISRGWQSTRETRVDECVKTYLSTFC
jgi:hypothetical protein